MPFSVSRTSNLLNVFGNYLWIIFSLPWWSFMISICSSSNVHPLVIAAHPQEAHQFAVGLSDGGVHVFEPLESEGKWGVPPPMENGSAGSVPTTPSVGAAGSDQQQRWCYVHSDSLFCMLAHFLFRYVQSVSGQNLFLKLVNHWKWPYWFFF